LVYTTAKVTKERCRARHKPEGVVRPKAADAKSFRAPARIAQQAKQPADVDDREGIVRPIASLTLAP